MTELDELVKNAHADGGWGYGPDQAAQLEPTCLALLALSQSAGAYSDAITAGRRFLNRCRRGDGAYPLAKGRTEAVWATSLVLYTEAVLGALPEVLGPTAGFVLSYKGRIPNVPTHDELKVVDPKHDIDLNIVGWPWAENNFSWVEPTAWACLALRRVGQEKQPRVQDGLKMLIDRAMDTGGVNYGNRRILDKILEPIPGPTALMLIALQGQSHPRIDAAIKYLLTEIQTSDLEHLCWARIALDFYRDRPGVETAIRELGVHIPAAAEERKTVPWVRPANVRLALIALAKGVDKANAFRLPPTSATVSPTAPGPSKKSIGERIGAWFRGIALKGASNLRQLPTFSGVHIARAANYDADLASILASQYEHFRASVPLKGRRVVLKPNLVEYHKDRVINTHPKVIGAAIDLCRAEGAADVVVAEGPGHWRNVEYLVAECGLGEVLKEKNVRFVDLNHDEPMRMPNLGQLTGLDFLFLARTIAKADVVISMPKLKTHHWAGATLSLKNLFGTVPGICYGWPKNELHWRGIDNSIVDIALTRTPDLAIVDGIIGMEGDGPLMGNAKPLGAIVMGHDLVAVDATCCRLMKILPDKLGYIVMGNARKLGRLNAAEIPQLGESIESLAQPFAQVEHFQSLRA